MVNQQLIPYVDIKALVENTDGMDFVKTFFMIIKQIDIEKQKKPNLDKEPLQIKISKWICTKILWI